MVAVVVDASNYHLNWYRIFAFCGQMAPVSFLRPGMPPTQSNIRIHSVDEFRMSTSIRW